MAIDEPLHCRADFRDLETGGQRDLRRQRRGPVLNHGRIDRVAHGSVGICKKSHNKIVGVKYGTATEGGRMVRKTMKMLLVATLAAFTAATAADAATTTKVRHRQKHSTRVSSGATATTGKTTASTKKRTTKKRAVPTAKRGTAKSTAKKSTKKSTVTRHKPTTKPR